MKMTVRTRTAVSLLIAVAAIQGALAGDFDRVLRTCRPSRRNLVASSLVTWQGGTPVLRKTGAAAGSPQQLRLLALMAEFQPDDDLRTTGDGTFISEPAAEAVIDPSPHDRAYFTWQLQALSRYYDTVSGGSLAISGSVAEPVLQLPHTMSYYSPAGDDDLKDLRLAELFRDAVRAADSSGVVFSGYDCFIVFHAGVGKDISLDYDATPQDVPSVFLSAEDLEKRLGDTIDPEGIPVQNGQFHVPEGLILPETESQEGYEIGLLGTMTLMFGFQLGMPALWNTDTGRSGIGRWGLMDQGSGNFNGLIPARPCAWTRVFMGWDVPVVLQNGVDLPVSWTGGAGHPRIYKVPIDEDEYFLVENRQYDANGDSAALGTDAYGSAVRFRSDGRIEAAGAISVIVEIDDYDFGMPGSGLLIWHIDERVIRDNLQDNRINSGPIRGVDLEEADGAQDIGESYGFFSPGGGSENGVLHDAWFAGNEINLLANHSETVAFTNDTYPSSRANSGADSHISMTGFSRRDTLMSFSVESGFIQPGFPGDLIPGQQYWAPFSADLDGDSQREIIVTSAEGYVYAWKRDGSPLITNTEHFYRHMISGDSTRVDLPVIVHAASGFAAPAVTGMAVDLDAVLIATLDNSGMLSVYRGEDSDHDGYADLFFSQQCGDQPSALAFITGAFIVGSKTGQLRSIDVSGTVNWETSFAGAITGLCRHGGAIAVTVAGQGLSLVSSTGAVLWSREHSSLADATNPAAVWAPTGDERNRITVLAPWQGIVVSAEGDDMASLGSYILPETLAGPAIGDMDGDGRPETALSGDGHIWVFGSAGALLDFFPLPRRERETALSAPILADVDDDGLVDVVVSTSKGTLEAFGIDGQAAGGFPLSAGSGALSSPAAFDLDSDGDIELAAVSAAGYLYVWDLMTKEGNETVPWGMPRHDSRGGACLDIAHPVQMESGRGLMPEKLVYNYPNPAVDAYTTIRYHLTEDADVRIRIFDLTGFLRKEFTRKGRGSSDNEVVWDLSDVDSGVYFCEVRAVSATTEKAVRFRIGVIH